MIGINCAKGVVKLDNIALKTGLLGFVIPSGSALKVLVVESCLYLPELRELLPKGELHAVVADETVAELDIYQNLGIKWHFCDYNVGELDFQPEYFDYIIGERCLELAENPKRIADRMCRILKETGFFLSTFQNVRYWEVLKGLMEGQFNYLSARPFSKADYTRLLGSSLFKDVVYAPQKVKAPVKLIDSLEKAGFDNEGDDLEVAVWMVQAARSEPEILGLKTIYTRAVRKKLSTLLRRIEYSIGLEENGLALAELCDSEGIFPDYLRDYISHMCYFQDRLLANLVCSWRTLNREWYLQEMGIDSILEDRENRHGRMKEHYSEDYAVREDIPASNRIAFISCVNQEELYEEALLYIKRLKVPSGMHAEIIPIRGAASMCQGYNLGMSMTKAKYKVYVHQDCFIVNENFIYDIIDLFTDNSVGLVGTIGCQKLPPSGIWWDGKDINGRIMHACEPECIVDTEIPQAESPYMYMQAVDGLMLATQYDVPWREDLFDGWHFYDVSQCLELARRGYRVAVPYQGDFWCIHCPKEKPLEPVYYQYQKIFLKEYRGEFALEK